MSEQESKDTLKNKIDFVLLVSVTNANPNGDPLDGNRPRTDYNGFGEISDVCIKRKIRNRMQDLGESIFVKSDERCDDGRKTLIERAGELKAVKDMEIYRRTACEKWLDVRAFGQVFPFDSFECKSVGIRGPVSIHQAVSVNPVEIISMQITKSVSNELSSKKGKESDTTEGKKGSDTMGMKHFVRFGLYKIKGSINVQLAKKTGFSIEDSEKIKECLKTLFINDSSSARPDGSMDVLKLYWWEHNNKDGQYPSIRVHNSVRVKLKEGIVIPSSVEDYDISRDNLEGLICSEEL